jgi:hypothetical protein
MSQDAPNWNTTQYASRAMHIYQQEGNRLRPTVTQALKIVDNSKAVFWLAGKSKAKKVTRNERNQPSNAARKKVEVDLATWRSFDTVEEYDVDRMSVDEKEVVYQSGANALGRSTDNEIYLVAAAAAPTVDAGLDFSAGAFNAAQALTLCSALQNDKVKWDGNVYCGLPSLQWNQLIANKVVNGADHVGSGDLPFVKATDTRFWNGVNWYLNVEEDALDFYPVPSANKQDLFIWHKTAIGWGNHTDLSVITQWDNYENWWTINMTAKGCCTPLQEGKGIKRFTTSSNSAIAIV